MNSFLPVKVLPHVHAVVAADELSLNTVEILSGHVNDYLLSKMESPPLPPNTKIKRIEDEKSLLDRLGYMHKPLNLVKSYLNAWPAASFHNRHAAWRLNSELTDVVGGLAQITYRRDKLRYKGNLNPKAKEFIGIPKKLHDDYKEELRLLREEPATYWEDEDQQAEADNPTQKGKL